MANFTVRVELHHASAANYQTLHAAMLAAGFVTTITSDAGSVYRLPTAEYNWEGVDISATEMTNAVRAIADAVKIGAWVLVSRTVSRAWFLPEAQ